MTEPLGPFYFYFLVYGSSYPNFCFFYLFFFISFDVENCQKLRTFFFACFAELHSKNYKFFSFFFSSPLIQIFFRLNKKIFFTNFIFPPPI